MKGTIDVLEPNQPRHVTRDLAAELFELYGNSCVYCGGYADTLDHVIPKHFGGRSGKGNLVPSCARCNYMKRAKYLVCSRKSRQLGVWAGEAGFRNFPIRALASLPRVRDLAFGYGTQIRKFKPGADKPVLVIRRWR